MGYSLKGHKELATTEWLTHISRIYLQLDLTGFLQIALYRYKTRENLKQKSIKRSFKREHPTAKVLSNTGRRSE